MKKSINKIKFLTLALALSVLVFSCNPDDFLNKANTLFNNFGGMMDGTVATDSQVEQIKGSCRVQVYSSNASGITVSETIADSDLACSVDRPPSRGHAQGSDEVWLAIANVKGVKNLAPKFLVSDMVDPGESGIGDYLVPFDSAGNPLDSEGVFFQENSAQQPSLIFLQATRNGWCFVNKKDPTKAYVVTFTVEKNVDNISPDGTCDDETIFTLTEEASDSTGGNDGTGGTGGTGNFVGNCRFINYGTDGTPQPLPYKEECVVDGSTLTAYTSLGETGKYKSALLNSDTGLSTFYNPDGTKQEPIPGVTIQKIVVEGKTWTISASADGGATFIKLSAYEID